MLAIVTVLGSMVVGLVVFYLISEMLLAILEFMFNVTDETMGYRIIGGLIIAIIIFSSVIPQLP
ncbi:hypothetical protein [Bacillus phage Megatron]|uniref:Uncharacterized protein n=1 Tax=Bacillus phage Megatron TaxID=1486661 RepID=A0A024B3J2_9CAUD|nr:hypothetical protein FP75_gp006 [Bacillus phage Megatron]AHZ10588.1 hypothetical protein [Bacillus phage Megatron]